MLKMNDLTEKLHLGRTTIYRLISDGVFPPGYGDGRYRRWPEPEIEAYMILLWEVPHELPNGIHAETIERLKEMATMAKSCCQISTPSIQEYVNESH